MKHKKVLIAFIIGVLISGCSSSKQDSLNNLPPELRQSAMVTVASPHVSIPQSGSFTWMFQSIQFFDDPRVDYSKWNEMLQGAIRDALQAKGYSFEYSVSQSDLLVGYFVALDTPQDDASMNQLYSLDPGFSTGMDSSNQYPKGALILDIVDAKTRQLLWRGALQANVDLDLDNDLRLQRIDLAVKQLLSAFPSR